MRFVYVIIRTKLTYNSNSPDTEPEEDDSVIFRIKSDRQHQSPKTEVFTPNVTAALDRNKITDREEVRILIPIASAFVHNPW